ncbi:hypothetical protein [Fodinicola feengrottensis]|nr:hypothetical protein [Fodinicola feengrottensis]
MPGSLDEASLRRAFANDWHIERMQRRRYTSNMTRDQWREQVPAELVSGILPAHDDPEGIDSQGRVLMPIWQITAQLT